MNLKTIFDIYEQNKFHTQDELSIKHVKCIEFFFANIPDKFIAFSDFWQVFEPNF